MPAAGSEPVFEQTLEIVRVFDAPRDLVFRAWTEPERFARWWGPRGCTTTHCEVDLRPGGSFVFQQQHPDAGTIRCRGTYLEIDAPNRLVWTWAFVDAQGNIARHPSEPQWPLETHVELSLAERGGRTTMTIRQRLSTTARLAGMAEQGWNSCLELLGEALAASHWQRNRP